MTKIDNFFKELQNKKLYMEILHEEYVRALHMSEADFSISTNTNFNEIIVSGSRKINGLEGIFQYVQEKEKEYKIARNDYENEKKLCMLTINKLTNNIYRLIIKYTYIDEYNNKNIIDNLEKYHRIYYSEDYFRKIKTKAIRKFESLI